MILVLVPKITSRLKYTFDLILNTILKVDYSFTTDAVVFEQFNGAKFSYGKTIHVKGLHYGAAALLFEESISRQELEKLIPGEEPKFFKVPEGRFDFDPFACSFYLVSRYEEYLPHLKDRHKRFSAEESLAFKGGFLERPMINVWSQAIKNHLIEYFPKLHFPLRPFNFLPTIDIDNAFAYKYKGLVRSIGSLLLLLFEFNLTKLRQRIMVQMGYQQDPYDTYEKQHKIHTHHHIKPLYFILLGDYGKYDKNLSHTNSKYVELIKDLDKKAEVCLHPSYGSSNTETQLQIEKRRLESIVNRPVQKSRHHFIRINLPSTYRKLILEGFKEDYSMGYPDKVGYRASIATPFYFYDLEEEKTTDLKIFPFVVMDVTLKKYLHIRSKDVVPYLKPIIEENKALGGNFIFIFHNESMGGEKMWRNWSDLYEKIIKLSMS